ncbi:MAG: FAD-binding oxidoreductase [Acidobacteria bacterium]|nr:FAD-binding oxidoreductase [Acidobacteriota bacterium]
MTAPTSPSELCDALRTCAERNSVIETGGAFSKPTMGGPIPSEAVRVTTSAMTRLLAYEPADLTISVEAGMPWRELNRILDDNNQFVPVDPAYGQTATVGGVVATDSSGPRRRRYGSARDVTIGMTFATVEGKLIQSGGMVVKNVTGLDMAKLMIGSFGTLATIATVNFKVLPKPVAVSTFVFSGDSLASIIKLRTRIIASQLQPVALDLVSGSGVADVAGAKRYRLIAEAHGNASTVTRYEKEYGEFAQAEAVDFIGLDGPAADQLWNDVREFSSSWIAAHPEGGILRVSTAPSALADTIQLCEGSSVSRAALGVTYVGCSDGEELKQQLNRLRSQGVRTLVEHASAAAKQELEQWTAPDSSLAVMQRLKNELDPQALLNPGRLFGKI